MAEEAKSPEENTAAPEAKDETATTGDTAPQDAEQQGVPAEEAKPQDTESKEETDKKQEQKEMAVIPNVEEDTLSGIGLKVIDKFNSPATSNASSVSPMVFGKNTRYMDYSTRFYKYMGLSMEEAEAEGGKQMKKEIVKIDRAPYYEKHKTLTKEIEDEKVRNNMIQKKLAQFFKKKRMDHVLKESNETTTDNQQKYDQKLDHYGEIIEVDSRQRVATISELTNLKEKRESKYNELINFFETIQRREKDIGTGLINTKTGKPIPDKLVERLIRLQKSQMETINTMRLKYIRLKDKVVEIQYNISVVDRIDKDLYLMDYEQLKIENRGLEDKIEERDEEITKLRSKYQSNIQILAHIREKSAALESDIDNLKEEVSTIDAVCIKV